MYRMHPLGNRGLQCYFGVGIGSSLSDVNSSLHSFWDVLSFIVVRDV
jgi:hypothetical protein